MQRRAPKAAFKQLANRPAIHASVLENLHVSSAYSKKQADKKFALATIQREKERFQDDNGRMKRYKKQIAITQKQARKNFKEDWALGPLAPKRDLGSAAGAAYAAAEENSILTVVPRMEWKLSTDKHGDVVGRRDGKPERKFKLLPGDRVVVIRGRHKGKIGTVRRVLEGPGRVYINGLNLVDFILPEWQQKAEGDDRPFRSSEAPFPYLDVRLVHPVFIDEESLETKEVIVDSMDYRYVVIEGNPNDWIWVNRGTVHSITKNGIEIGKTASWSDLYPDLGDDEKDDKTTRRREGRREYGVRFVEQRYIPVFNQLIKNIPDHENDIEPPAYEDDTLLIQTEEETFIPTLKTPPMPEIVIDELRNKYGRFRARHEESYVEAKVDDLNAKQNKMIKLGKSMKFPIRYTNEMRAKLAKPEETKMKLTEDMLAQIGLTMAKNLGGNAKLKILEKSMPTASL